MNCSEFQETYFRRKKVVAVGCEPHGGSHFYVLDTAKPIKRVDTEVSVESIAPFDGETLVVSNGGETLSFVDLNTGKVKATQTSEIDMDDDQIIVIGDWVYSVEKGRLVRTRKDLMRETRTGLRAATRQISEDFSETNLSRFTEIDGKVASIHSR